MQEGHLSPSFNFWGIFAQIFTFTQTSQKLPPGTTPPEIFGCWHLTRKCKTVCYGFLVKMAVTLCARLKADGLHTKGAHSPHGLLPKSATNLVSRSPSAARGCNRNLFGPRYLGHFSRYYHDVFVVW